MQDSKNLNGQQTAPAPKSIFDSVAKEEFPVMLSLLRQSIKIRFEKLAFDAAAPHDLCYEQSTALEVDETLQQIKACLQLLNEETCFLYNELRLLDSLQKLI